MGNYGIANSPKLDCDDDYRRKMKRNFYEDMKKGTDILRKFHASLDDLHPKAAALITRMVNDL